jgi:hypothetical protein
MKTISFDIGIKNMAYCVFDCSTNVDILEWKVISLMEEQQTNPICSCKIIPKSKKAEIKPCKKIAKYSKNNQYYCEKHATESQYLLPTKENTFTQIKKKKNEDLIKWGKQHFLFLDIENLEKPSKQYLLDTIQKYLENKCLQPVKKVKNKTASETDLVVIGKNMKKEFNKNRLFQEVETIIIENQISPIANRMKTIQGMLAQYFIMINDASNIQFISSSNKLKQFVVEGSRTTKLEEIKDSKKTNPNYKEHKKDGIYYCENILKRNENLNYWIDSLDVKKKDDLADAFLQGLWYFKNKNIITYADDLKINIV